MANDLADAARESPIITRVNQSFRAGVPQIFVDVDRAAQQHLQHPASQPGFGGFDLNVHTRIALILLIGLAAKSAILIVEFAKQQEEEEGLGIVGAATIAASLRFRPILMTAFSFIFGIIPLVKAGPAEMPETGSTELAASL